MDSRKLMLPGMSVNEMCFASSCARNFRSPSADSPYNDEGAASPMTCTPSASVSSTMPVRWVPEPLELAIFQGLASNNSHGRAVNITPRFKQVFNDLQPD